MNEIKTGACINYISIIVRLATQFFLTPFTLSSLGENEYGIFMLSNSVIAWLSLTDFGLGVTVNKYIATYHAKAWASPSSIRFLLFCFWFGGTRRSPSPSWAWASA